MTGRLKKIKSSLVRALKISDDLRTRDYKGHSNFYAGHCYIVSELLYHMLGGKKAGLKPFVMRVKGNTHWFLKDKNGRIIDPTAKQFNFSIDYTKARACGFLTKKMSKRAQKLAERMDLL